MLRRALLPLMLLLPAPFALAGDAQWLVTTDLWGNPAYQLLTLPDSEGTLRGRFDGDPLQGRRQGDAVDFTVTGNDGAVYRFTGQLRDGQLHGQADYPDTNTAGARAEHAFSARRLPDRPAGGARLHAFTPTSWSNEFSAHRAPVLTLWPGDSVQTTTLDSGGVDAQGKTRALFGNPQTGPFYVMDAEPGDVLAVHISKLRLNRDYADSLDSIVGRALTPALAAKATALGKPVRWQLDRERGRARPQQSSGRLKDFWVPVQPMLGGLAVAPGFGNPPMSTGDTGRYGGNMDFNEVREGATVYLPVYQPGALLYLGDAHALQGDGETSQYALETSMDVEFRVELVKARPQSAPRVESATQLMVLGQAGSLDDALRAATAGMAQWLEQDYGLDLSETAQVMGSSVKFVVANLAGRSVGVAAKLDKALLGQIPRRAAAPAPAP
ncbi:acetamidase/formamidase family protein [Stenotrophomonas rhizophila]|uniref:acetamidase/formamidase family protein n=1 Tax=Stenotrophomonas rhizophila TaxID=216778 RepID=UPI001E562632|nr:acetamidase/formamidase family protein [Stenotrophomonas rhizophila]MCC7632946.1 acetamidase/formamidase family protein [Stenotrophomonas rhizophila]MCC7662329.1 acetamidase/formamidase family protein [Stenotrophomonas rhizophila]